ncbi:MAG: methyl-accepting chemotaxis protein, partial [Deltaproteobacteria bacterium]|nr:methyl-accepting chemotaxis protein [Deltaproteobacteria bacterium]
EQSKILAVNASIEAAKAGEFGSGFAVVAQEVKNLAGQSKDATEQITHTLTSIRQSVEMMVRLSRAGEERTVQGVESIANAGAIVNDLSDAIQEASEVANEIESSVNQQSMGLSQIASAMDEINISASENQEISHNMERGTTEITEALKELNMLVDVWTTADDLAAQKEAK